MIDLQKIHALLAELTACDEKIADREPLKILPRPTGEAPDVPRLREKIAELKERLRCRRKNTKTAKGHDLLGDGTPRPGLNLAAIGVVEEVKEIARGQDLALPEALTVVRVGFPAGEHLWFDPHDLTMLDPSLELEKAHEKAHATEKPHGHGHAKNDAKKEKETPTP